VDISDWLKVTLQERFNFHPSSQHEVSSRTRQRSMDFPKPSDKAMPSLLPPSKLRDDSTATRILPWWRVILLSLIAICLIVTYPNPFHYFRKPTIEEKAIQILTDNPLIGLFLLFLLLRDNRSNWAMIQMATTTS
jgi:hypothetical protein